MDTKFLKKQKDRAEFNLKIDDLLQNYMKEIKDFKEAIDSTMKLEESLKKMFEVKILEKNENLINNFNEHRSKFI